MQSLSVVVLHRWTALMLGALFVLIGLTGSLLVFQSELDRALNPELLRATAPIEEPISPQQAVSAIESLEDEEGSPMRVALLSLPQGSHSVYRAHTTTPERFFDRLVTVDPGDGKVLGERRVEEGLVRFLRVLHLQFHLGGTGQNLLGFVGVCLLFSLLSGLLIWWRRRRPGHLHSSVHPQAGVWFAAPLLVVTLTGLLLALPQFTRPAVELFSPLSSLDLDRQSEPAADQDDPGLDAMLDQAIKAMPDGEIVSVSLPRNETGSYRITLRERNPQGLSAGRGHVVLDRYSGEVLASRHWSERSSGDHFMAWLRSLHDGSALGLPGKLLVAVLGIVPLVLYITGLRFWLRRNRRES